MDFHRAFREIDTDGSGEITRNELEEHMRQHNYKPAFVEKWLKLFDIDGDGQITYDEYCTTLGLVPVEPVVEEGIIQTKKTAVVQATPSNTAKPVGKSKGTKEPIPKRSKHDNDKNNGISLHSRSDAFRRKTIYKYAVKDTATDQKPTETRSDVHNLSKDRRPQSFNQQEPKRKKGLRPKKCFSQHKRRLRSSITPGTLLILLTGRHRGKRVVFLKQLASGLLLVTGPFKLNGVPLRRVHQKFVIATATKVSLSNVEVPERLDDVYFRRSTTLMKKHKQTRIHKNKKSNDLFQSNSSSAKLYKLSEERKQDQKLVDKQVLQRIQDDTERGASLKGYLSGKFSLFNHDFPHQMKF